MPPTREHQTLSELLTAIGSTVRDKPQVTAQDIYEAVGQRAFGPLLLAAGLLALTPLGLIPGAPTVLAIIIVLLAAQLLIGRKTFWLPRKVLRLKVRPERVERAVRAVRPVARVVDRVLRPRLEFLTTGVGVRLTAIACLVIALAVPPLELVPFGVFFPAVAVTAFGLGLIFRDGLVTLVALASSGGAIGMIATALLG
ncbi:MAG TPA: exopolysaccharide biosynthesis protein [Phenylobacterium sp.]